MTAFLGLKADTAAISINKMRKNRRKKLELDCIQFVSYVMSSKKFRILIIKVFFGVILRFFVQIIISHFCLLIILKMN